MNRPPPLPGHPGVYLFRSAKKEILYIGKAKNIKKRIASYFGAGRNNIKTRALMDHVRDIDFIVTGNELEALILENNLIKKHQPKYNIDLKDSKTYAYILLTKESFPRLISVRDRQQPGTYFGPFPSAGERNRILSVVRDIFHLRTCRKMRSKPCLRGQIGLCDQPCQNHIHIEDYHRNVDNARGVLKGRISPVIDTLSRSMNRFSRNQNYESALRMKDQMEALGKLKKKQAIERKKKYDEDIIHYRIIHQEVYLMVFHIHQGILKEKEEFHFPIHGEFLEEFLLLYYSSHRVPGELILPVSPDPALVQYLENRRGKKVRITIPEKGEKKSLLDLVARNIQDKLNPREEALRNIADLLQLPSPPLHMECVDVSHLTGRFTTASLVCFKNGLPAKEEYRRFRIKSLGNRIDDPQSISEVIFRRYSRMKKEGRSLPNLVIIDGGRPQLNAALSAIEKTGLRLPVIGIAKAREQLILPELPHPLDVDHKNAGLNLIREIRDEAHRFALKYNRLLRHKNLLS